MFLSWQQLLVMSYYYAIALVGPVDKLIAEFGMFFH